MKCIVELFGDDRNGRKMIAWGRRIGCADAGHVFDAERRKIVTRLVVDDTNSSQKSYLLELVDNPAGVRAIVPEESTHQCRRHWFDPYVRKIPWKRKWQSTPVFLPEKPHGQRSMEGHSPWGSQRAGHN